MSEPEQERVVIRDNRKIDRDVSPPADGGTATATEEPVVETAEAPMVEARLLDERTADLQRLQAEYANYRKRADRDRLLAGDAAVAQAVSSLIPVVDDVQRARQHGDVVGPFESVAEKLDRALAMLGLTEFGFEGDPFDPTKHEAVQHDERADVAQPTCTTIMRKGYMFKDRLLRPAMVGVSDPSTPAAEPSPATEVESQEHASTENENHQ